MGHIAGVVAKRARTLVVNYFKLFAEHGDVPVTQAERDFADRQVRFE